jgi:hypothetical protein
MAGLKACFPIGEEQLGVSRLSRSWRSCTGLRIGVRLRDKRRLRRSSGSNGYYGRRSREGRHSVDVAALTAFLAPFLPYLVRGSRTLVEEAGKVVGEDAWGHATALWQRLWPRVEAKPAALDAADDLAQHPDDEEARIVLKRQLEKLLTEDDVLKADIARLWSNAEAANVVVAIGDRSVVVSRDVVDSIIVTGDDAKIG